MSEMTLFKGGLPAFLKSNELDETTRALMGSGGVGAKRISIKGNVFRMMSNGEEVATNEDRAMNIIIVKAAANVSRTFYEGIYKEGEIVSPACWSSDGLRPDPKAPSVQGVTCDKCPNNIKGSGQGESKACRYSRKLAVVLEGDVNGDVYQLALPATSIFGKGENDKLPLEAYVRYLASHNVPVTAVVTEMRFDTKSPVPKLTFKAVRGLTEVEWETCRSQGETADAVEAIQHTFSGATAAKGKSKLAPAPLNIDVPEPVRIAAKKAEPVSAKPMDELLTEWADD
jgi:hypothetical protein